MIREHLRMALTSMVTVHTGKSTQWFKYSCVSGARYEIETLRYHGASASASTNLIAHWVGNAALLPISNEDVNDSTDKCIYLY
jgi:hypothetical protein